MVENIPLLLTTVKAYFFKCSTHPVNCKYKTLTTKFYFLKVKIAHFSIILSQKDLLFPM